MIWAMISMHSGLTAALTYSSAIFASGSEGLEDAQRAKYGRIVDHLAGNSGHLLEIGCGWGGFAGCAQSRGVLPSKD